MSLRSSRLLSIAALAVAALLVLLQAVQNRAIRKDVFPLCLRETLPYPGFLVATFEGTTLAGDAVRIGAGESGQGQVLSVFRTMCGFKEVLCAG